MEDKSTFWIKKSQLLIWHEFDKKYFPEVTYELFEARFVDQMSKSHNVKIIE